MNNAILFVLTCLLLACSMFIGYWKSTAEKQQEAVAVLSQVPSVGSIQILNGCGMAGAGIRVADFIRSRGFDVKNIDNAKTWNYPFTMVVSRKDDLQTAQEIARILATDKVIVLRTDETMYDVVVYIGPDFEERIKTQ